MYLSKVIGTNARSNIMVELESITTTQNQTSMRMKMNLKKTGRSKLTNLKVTLTQVTLVTRKMSAELGAEGFNCDVRVFM
jgi:hypothetical protein